MSGAPSLNNSRWISDTLRLQTIVETHVAAPFLVDKGRTLVISSPLAPQECLWILFRDLMFLDKTLKVEITYIGYMGQFGLKSRCLLMGTWTHEIKFPKD